MNGNVTINFMPLNIGTLVLIGIGAIITIFGIIWGTMRRRAKAAAIADSLRHERAIRDVDDGDNGPVEPPVVADPPPEPAPIPLAPVAVSSVEATPEQPPEPTPEPTPGPMPELHPEPTAVDPSPDRYPLTMLKGLGPRAATALAAHGVASIADLAALDPARAAAIDAGLGPLAGRIARDRWIEQARLLIAGDLAGYEAAFGKIGG